MPASLLSIYLSRRRRQRYDLAVRPMWVDVGLGVVGCVAVVAGVALIANRYDSPVTGKPPGVAYPVVILIGVTLLMTYLARRRRFGRYVYAYGGNPEAAELSGINTRRTVMLTFVLMGVLVAVSAAIQTARLNSAVTNLGVQNELDVIAAAVIGGTSFSGGIGTVPGAVLGAVIMQSLRSGMVLLNIDSPSQDVVVGVVLVAAVAVDAALRSGRRRAAVAALVAGLIVAAVVIQTGQPYERGRQHHRPMQPADPPPSQRGAVPLVEMRDIRVAFGGVHAVDGVSVDLYPGEVVALVGGNGAGKSTLMHTLSGAHPADSGQILINGEPVTIHDPRDAQKHGIETIYQKLALADNIDAAGNVFLGREMRTRTGALDDSAMASATQRGDAASEPAVHEPQDPGRVAVGWAAPGGGDRPGDPLQRQDPDHGRAHGGARAGRDGAGARARRPAEVGGHRHLPHQPRHPRRLRPRRPDQRDAARASSSAP